MPTAPSSTCFVEQNDFSLLLARGTAGGRSLRIDALQEIPFTDTSGLTTAGTVLTAGLPIVCALRPKLRRLHLATLAEASAHSGLAGTRAFSRAQSEIAGQLPTWSAATRARDGSAPTDSPWLLTLTSKEGYTQALAQLEGLRIKPTRYVSATHHAIGAIASGATTPTLLLEFGEFTSYALLIGPDGLLAASPTSLNLDRIAEAVQAELGMKFRGSAVKLLFSPDYDFTEVGPKIAARLAVILKPELVALRSATPPTFACTGLPAMQHWLGAQLASALGLAPATPNVKSWCASAGLTFAKPEIEAALSPMWMGFLRLISTAAHESSGDWQADWCEIGTTAVPTAPAATAKTTSPVAAAKPAAPVPAIVSIVAPSKSAAKPAAPAAAPKAATVATVVKSAVVESSVSYPPKSTAVAKPTPKKNSEIVPAKSVVAVAMSKAASASERKFESTPNVVATSATKTTPALLRRPAMLAVAATVVLLSIGGFFYAQSQQREMARVAAEKTQTERRLAAEAERARLAEQSARAEAESRRKFEVETTQKLAAAETARQQAENETRTQVAARLANARGTLVFQEPVGATVTVGSLPPRTAPATFEDIKIGRYPVTVALLNHEPMKLELEVRENATTDAGPLKLERLVGTLVIKSEPADVSYSVRPANAFFVAPGSHRTGRTPATLADLTPGEYVITFTRPGWPAHDETVTIGRAATVQTNWVFPSGVVKLTSHPLGASVTREGTILGVTPLTLSEQVPGAASYELSLPGYDTETLSGQIQPGQVLALTRTLESEDRIARLSDTDERPVPILMPQPEVSSRRIVEPLRVDIQLVVDRYGNTRDLSITKSSDAELGKLCLAAAAKWKFKPATINGKPVNVRVAVPFNIMPAS